jgi:hypothetical protein
MRTTWERKETHKNNYKSLKWQNKTFSHTRTDRFNTDTLFEATNNSNLLVERII